MIATDAEVWARLRLVQGRSNAELWEFVSAHSETLLTVGSGLGCSWVVQEVGVAPVHFTLHWDGAGLRIADTHGAGKVRVDGALIHADFRPLSGRVRIEFGNAAMVVETSSARAKSTLRDAAPLAARGTPIVASPPVKRTALESKAPGAVTPPASSPAPGDSAVPFVPKRPDSGRAPKPTLLGMAQAAPASTNPPPAANSSVPPPKRVAGASLADADQRTIQGFSSAGSVVKAPPSITVGSPSSTPPPQQLEPAYFEREVAPRAAVPREPSPRKPPASQPQPGTTLVVAHREESGRQYEPRGNESGFAAHPHNVPQTVVVLSPMGGAPAQPEVRQRNSSGYARRSLPPARHVAFAVAATVVTYAAWVYLLYHL